MGFTVEGGTGEGEGAGVPSRPFGQNRPPFGTSGSGRAPTEGRDSGFVDYAKTFRATPAAQTRSPVVSVVSVAAEGSTRNQLL